MAKRNKENKGSMLVLTMITILIAGVICFSMVPLFEKIHLGLDLKGGFEILYEVESLDGSEVSASALTSTRKTLARRIDGLGVTEPNIEVAIPNRIRIQLAGITSPDEARNMLGKTANLTFRDVNDNLLMNADVLESGSAKIGSGKTPGSIAVVLTIKDIDKFYEVTKKISEMASPNNKIITWLDFEEGKDSYQAYINNCDGENGSKCISAAQVTEGLASRNVTIEGSFTDKEASNLKELINSGSLPTKLTEISSKTVSASFGIDSLNKTLIAGIVGIFLIIVMMTAIYRFAGFISGISMIIYTFLTFLLFYLIGGTLTLPGIAAIVIGIGMAVDSNVISFERIKEELYQGRSLETAFENGNKRSLITILDANITTLLVAVILFIFGESSVKGFATMFIINIVVTLIVMFFITRFILKLFVKTGYFDSHKTLFIGIKKERICDIHKSKKEEGYHPFQKLDFVRHRKKFFIGTIIIIGAVCLSMGLQGFSLGIDYLGGSNITIKSETMSEENVKKELETLNYTIVDFNKISQGYDVKIKETLTKEQILAMNQTLEDDYQADADISVISTEVKNELIKNAILATILGCVGMVIYITIRYRFNYAISAIIALLHDVLITLGIFSIFHLEVSSMIIAAILAIIGYSVNDTIVSFDRIRENLHTLYQDKISSEEQLNELVNKSLREVFLRSIYTTVTTLIPVICLIILGSHEINLFNIALFVGLIAGSYSSLFIASQIWLSLEKKNIGVTPKKKWYDVDDELDEVKIKGINS